MPLDRERLSKLMSLTTSDQDGEALSALRMANKLLLKEKMSWDEVLKAGDTTINFSPFGFGNVANPVHAEDWEEHPAHLRDQEQIAIMFQAIYSIPRTGNEDYWRIMDGIHESFKQHRSLTRSNYAIIREAYKRSTRRA